MPQYMIIERFREGNSAAIYDRFAAKGRMLPNELRFLDSWLSQSDDTCYQLMETERPESFDKWIAHWDDLVEFEIVELKEKPTKGQQNDH